MKVYKWSSLRSHSVIWDVCRGVAVSKIVIQKGLDYIYIHPEDEIYPTSIDLHYELRKSKNVPYIKVKRNGKSVLLIDRCVMDVIEAYKVNDGFAGMALHEYLDRVFSK